MKSNTDNKTVELSKLKEIVHYKVRTDLYYQPANHFWLEIENTNAKLGMSPLLQETSGAIVAIQFNIKKNELKKGESFASLEAEKNVSHLSMPVSGKIIEVNEAVIENPRLINSDPYGEGWLVKIDMTNWENERNELIGGEEDITEWFQFEIKKYDAKGWIAQH